MTELTNSWETPASVQEDYTYPQHPKDAGQVFSVFYYGVAIPVSYVGNLFTYIIVCKLLRYRHSTSDVLVGGLALNDVLTATIVFTPSLVSAARGRYFGSRTMCEFSAVTTVWYIYTTFALIVLINSERWLALTRPFTYKRLAVTGFKLKAIMGFLGFFCLMLASIPLLRYPVVLKAGWYCAPAHVRPTGPPATLRHNLNDTTAPSTASTATEVGPVLETMYIKLVYLFLGILLLVACNLSVAYTLRRRPFGDAASREVDRKFARLMGVVAGLFLLTWLPNLAAQALCLAGSSVCQELDFWAMRIVNVGVAINPVVYGVMKTTYRRGYLYLARVSLHYLSLTLLPPPSDGQEIFDLRERFLSNKRATTSSTTTATTTITTSVSVVATNRNSNHTYEHSQVETEVNSPAADHHTTTNKGLMSQHCEQERECDVSVS